MEGSAAHPEGDIGSVVPIRGEIVAVIKEILAREASITQDVSEETDLLAELKLDSIRQLALVVAVENRFEICFEPEDELAINTVGSVARIIERRLLAKQDGERAEAAP